MEILRIIGKNKLLISFAKNHTFAANISDSLNSFADLRTIAY
jgi:hypothetical protein